MEFRHRAVAAGSTSLHVVESGDPGAPPYLFLHGWPESWRVWRGVLAEAGREARAIAVDLPGVGGSTGAATGGAKRELAEVIGALAEALELRDLTLVGHDIGGMVAYAYLRSGRDLAGAVIMDVAVPGVPPWDAVAADPRVWHFGFHAVPDLPERLVEGRQAEYFGFFHDAINHDPSRITEADRAAFAAAYTGEERLRAGFSWYRAFPQDAGDNRRAAAGPPVATPVLYLRGEHAPGDVDAYVEGLTGAGLTRVRRAVVPGAGHCPALENPRETWRLIAGLS